MAVAVIAVLRNVFGLLGCAVERVVPAQSPPPWPDDFDWRCRTHGVIGPCAECEFDTPASVAGVGPAGERIPPTMPPAGRLADLDVHLVVELLAPHDLKVFAEHLRAYADELISPGRVLLLADLLGADPNP